jgi:Flp pilus assembly protein TadG
MTSRKNADFQSALATSARNKAVAAFMRNNDGAVVIPFAIMVFAVICFAGMAVDVASAYSAKSKLDAISDSASLAGAARARTEFLAQGVNSSGKTQQILASATSAATGMFATEISTITAVQAQSDVDVQLIDGKITSTVSYTATYRPHLLTLLGVDTIALAGTSISAAGLVPYMEITLLIDTSGSMAIGADAAGQAFLKSKIGCAFACHDNVAVQVYGDAHLFAKAKGVTLRYDAVNAGIVRLVDEFDALDPGATNIRASIRSFDTSFAVKQAMTTNRSQLRWNIPAAPATSGETQGATKFAEGISGVVSAIGTGGDGSSAANPVKILIIATDGVQDPGRFWVTQTAYRNDVAPFKMDFCQALKTKNVRVGILHTPYIPMPDDWGYMATLGQPSQIGGSATRADDVPRVLKECAGDLYVEAKTADAISAGFVNILRSTNTPRLIM